MATEELNMWKTEIESDAFEQNKIILEILSDDTGTTKYKVFNSRKEETAVGYITRGGLGHA